MAASSKLPPLACDFLRTENALWHKPIVIQFHNWLASRQLELAALKPAHVEEFLERSVKVIGDRPRLHYRYMVFGYLKWLWTHDHIAFDASDCFKEARAKPELSRSARDFMRTKDGHRCLPVVRRFHRWMEAKNLELSRLHPALIQRFLEKPSKRRFTRATLRNYRSRLLRYLDWLYDNHLIRFDPHDLRPHPKRLPPTAESFLSSLATTLKPSTCNGYKTALRKFHSWLRRNDRDLRTLDRQQLVDWFAELHRRKLHPSTRIHEILQVRAYFRWLYEHGTMQNQPYDLVRSQDLPKLPSYLPRPLPPQADRELQIRLSSSHCSYRLGLLLMRRTGLRIGELRALEFKCLRTDHQNHTYLKVPLGKLNTERLVPLDKKTLKLVRKLQRRGRRKRCWLLVTTTGKQTQSVNYNQILRKACQGLDIPNAINTHRLRHTYATSLLAGGMSLVGVMNLLGHRDYRMTLRYTAITQETVRTEYYDALTQIATRYELPASPAASSPDPLKMLSDLIRSIQTSFAEEDPSRQHASKLLLKRLRRVRTDLRRLTKNKKH